MKRIEKNWIKKDSSQEGWIEKNCKGWNSKGLQRFGLKRIQENWIEKDCRE